MYCLEKSAHMPFLVGLTLAAGPPWRLGFFAFGPTFLTAPGEFIGGCGVLWTEHRPTRSLPFS